MSTKDKDNLFENHPLVKDITRFVLVLFIAIVATAPITLAAYFIYRPTVALVLSGVFALSMLADPGIGRKQSDNESNTPDEEQVQDEVKDDGESVILGIVVPDSGEITLPQRLIILFSIGTIFSLMLSASVGFGALLGTAVSIETGYPLLGIAIATLYPVIDGFIGKYVQYNATGCGYLIGYNIVKYVYRPIWDATGAIVRLSKVNINIEMDAFERQSFKKLEYIISKH